MAKIVSRAESTDNLISDLHEVFRNLDRLSNALYAIANDLGGDTPPNKSIHLVKGESALALLALIKAHSEELLLNVDRIGSMIGYRGTQPPMNENPTINVKCDGLDIYKEEGEK